MDELAVHDTMAAALIERGLAAPDQVAADRAALVAELAGIEAPAATPVATETAQPAPGVDPLDALAFKGPETPAGYNFPRVPDGVATSLEQEQGFRQLFHAEGVPVSIAAQIGRLWNEAAAKPPNAAQIEHSRQECMSTLSKMYGADRDANVAVAQREIQRIEKARPGVVDMLDRSGLGNNAWLISTLVQLARAKGRHV